MARTGALKHTHQYYKRPDDLWACARDGCTHFMPRNMSPAPAGCKSICWNDTCKLEFILSPFTMRFNQPRCDGCTIIFDDLMKGFDQKLAELDDDPYLKQALEKAAKEKAAQQNQAKLKLVEDKPESEGE